MRALLPPLLASLPLLAGCGVGQVPQEVSLLLRVSALSPHPDLLVQADTTWLGQDQRLDLLDDGRGSDALAGDGIWTAQLRGPPVRLLPVRIRITRTGLPPVEAWEGIEKLSLDTDALDWALELDHPPRARRVTAPGSVRQAAWREATAVGWGMAWMIAVFGLVAWLAGRARGARP